MKVFNLYFDKLDDNLVMFFVFDIYIDIILQTFVYCKTQIL